jgi:hypothetical protein
LEIAHGTAPCASGITIRQTNSASRIAIHR